MQWICVREGCHVVGMILLHAPVATKVEELFYFIEVQEAEYACPIIALRFKT